MSPRVQFPGLSDTTSTNKKTNITFNGFFWDSFFNYIVTAILGLTVLDFISEFFSSGTVFCFHPPSTAYVVPSVLGLKEKLGVEIFSSDQAAFVNQYCSGSAPRSQYFPLYVLGQGLAMGIIHFIWKLVIEGDLNGFFSVAQKICVPIGNYPSDTINRAEHLMKIYEKKYLVLVLYILKLCLQLISSIASIAISAAVFTRFTFSFDCPERLNEAMDWPLNISVPCVYTNSLSFRILSIMDYILTSLAALLNIYGLIWISMCHPKKLGYKKIADFAVSTLLKPVLSFHNFPSITQHPNYMWNSTRIRNDLDFLSMALFSADTVCGQIFKDIEVGRQCPHTIKG